jgi:CelD/BcsL family acetyltransferase involved in cellulose biosynthesis
MRIVRYQSLDDLAPLAADWDRLARGVPFRSWAWLSTWWRHYGLEFTGQAARGGLCVLVVFDENGTPLGIAPWYWERSAALGRVLRFLGLGEVCSDYLSVLCQPQREGSVAEALAEWLTAANRPYCETHSEEALPWDLLELTAVDAEDVMMARLSQSLAACGNWVHRRPGANCWRIALPDDWETFLGRLSKPHRKQVRRLCERYLDSGRAVVHCVERLEDLAATQAVLIDLHQQRRRALGETGRFASPQFAAFHRDVMPALLRCGQLCLVWVEVDGCPVVAEYQVTGGGVVYAYQSGMDPNVQEVSPGHLGNLVTVRRSIAQGYRAFDFLRGDEPYKAHWRAEPRPSLEIRAVPARPSAQLRHGLWRTGSHLKHWIKRWRTRSS